MSDHFRRLLPVDLRVRKAFLGLIGVYLTLWWVGPALVHASPPLDVVEGWVWGKEWQAGYYKHPPLSPWLTAASVAVFGRNLWAIFVLSPLVTVGCFIALWILARQFLDEKASLISVYLASTQLYLNVLIPEFNHNVMQTPLWAAAYASAWVAFARPHWTAWFLLGSILGFCVLAKYSALLLIFVLAVFAVVDPAARKSLSLPGLLVASGAALLVCGVNLRWHVSGEFSALQYLGNRLGQPESLARHFENAASFGAAQALVLAPIVLIAVWSIRVAWRGGGFPPEASGLPGLAQRYLWVSALAPVAISMLAILITGKSFKSMWGTMMFSTLALAFVAWRPAAFVRLFSRRAWLAWLLFQGLMLFAYCVMMRWGPIYQHKVSKAIFPATELAAQLDEAWGSKTQGARLRYVVGDTWVGGVIAYGLPSAPSVMIDGDMRKSPWVSAEALDRCGALLVWPADRSEPAWVAALAGSAKHGVVEASVAGHPELRVALRFAVRPPTAGCEKR